MRWPTVLTLIALTSAAPGAGQATAPPDTEIFLASLSKVGDTPTLGQPVNFTNSPGYDNQPSFTPDGRGILFTSIRGGSQTDVYRYDIVSRVTTRVTDTPESEYSPAVTPDGAHISVIRVEQDGTQRLWQFTLDGHQPQLVLPGVKPVGYHAWAGSHTLVLFVLGSPATLQIADIDTGVSDIVASNVGRSIQPTPSRGTISFVERDGSTPPAEGVAPRLMIRELDPTTRRITPLVAAVAGAREADCAWTPDGWLLMAEKDVLYGWRRGDAGWKRLADLAALGLHGASRLAVSPAGDRLAIVAAGAGR
jgi:dipeptidyl aminopeptidase/acylaminoacyl peptidase